MDSSQNNPQMPQPQPTGGPAPTEINQTGPAQNFSSGPPPYDTQDPHPEYKAAFGEQSYPPPFPVQTNQPTPTPYPAHSANYYPTNVQAYPQPERTVVVRATGFGELPVTTQCSHCFQVVTTRVEYVTGSFTWMMCCIICLFCPLFCWLIPFFMIGMKDAHHFCPSCNHLIGIHSRL